jgi:lactoylglutathione lyase
MNIRGLYEIAIPVKDLSRAEEFYRGVLGFEVGLRDPKRPWVFMRIGAAAMIVLQETKTESAPMHFAFTVNPGDLDSAADTLKQRGIAVLGPITHDWVPARSAYFSDPDGHNLELIAPLGSDRA